MLKKLLVSTFAFMPLLVLVSCNSSQSYYTTEDFQFESMKSGGLKVVGFYAENPVDVVIPEGYNDMPVLSLKNMLYAGGEKLKGISSLKSVKLPDSIKTIGDFCFYNCVNLESVNFPSALEKISDSSFAFTAIKDAYLPEGLSKIEMYGFNNCKSLENVYLPSTVKIIQTKAFAYDDKIKYVYYNGSQEDFKKITISSSEDKSILDKYTYFYSETKPEATGQYWHYVDNEYKIW